MSYSAFKKGSNYSDGVPAGYDIHEGLGPYKYAYDRSQVGTAPAGYSSYGEYINQSDPALNHNWNPRDPFGNANPAGSPISGPSIYADSQGGLIDPLASNRPWLKGANIGNVLSNELYNRQTNLQSASPYSEGPGHGRLLNTLAALHRSAQGSMAGQPFGTTARFEQVRQQQPMLLGSEALGRFGLGEADRLKGINDLSLQNRNQQVGIMTDFMSDNNKARAQILAADEAAANSLGGIPLAGPFLAASKRSRDHQNAKEYSRE